MDGEKARIALCFANPVDQELLRRFVAELGHEPVSFLDEAAGCDLIFLDTTAARAYAEKAVEWKKNSRWFLPVLVGVKAGAASGPWLAAGFDDVLRLPCAKEELKARLAIMLRLRRQSEQLSRRSEYLHRALVESSADHIFVLDPNGRYISSNNRVAHFNLSLGEELVGKSLEEVFPPEVAATYQQKMDSVLATGKTVVFEHDLPSPVGFHYYLATLYRIALPSGEKLSGGICRDITERKRAFEILRKSEDKFYKAFDMSPNMMTITRLSDGRFLEASQSFLDIIGYSREEVIGRTSADINLWVDPQDRQLIVKELRQSGMVEQMETRINTRESTIRICLISARSIDFQDTDCILIVGMDITDRVQAEEARRLLETAIDRLAEGVFLCDRDNRILYANPALARITGYGLNEIRGKTPGLFKSGRHDSAFYRELKETIYDGRPWQGYLTTRKKDGSCCEVFATITPIMDAENTVSHFVSIYRDVTREREAEQRLRQHQRLEAIGILAGGIAHDFNNILTPILGYTELCENSLPPGSAVRDYLDQILLAAKRARDLVQQILSFSRKSRHERAPLLIGPVVKEALKLLRASIPATIDIRQDIAPLEETVVADPTEVHQVIMNLCTNAFHAMPEGGTLSVSLKALDIDREMASPLPGLKPGRHLKLSVSDTGRGIPPEIIDKIFEPYFTTKEAGRGTGLGLATSHGIIASCGGALTVSSEVGSGSTFDVYLPVSNAASQKTAAIRSEVRGGHEKILFVDDDAAIANLGKQTLERYGYQVTSRSEPAGALAQFRKNTAAYDLVVTDLAMPGMTGEDLAKSLLALRPDLPIILCTGFSDRINADKAKKMGFAQFLNKPVLPGELAEAIRRLLDKNSGNRSNE